MNDARSARRWTFFGLAALIVTSGVVSWRQAVRRAAEFSVEEDLRDSVAEPASFAPAAAARIALGKPVPVSWFDTPAARHADLDRALLSARRRRALARSVSVQ
jgi:hypothetical protein